MTQPRGKTEAQIQDEVRLALNHPDAVFWRNNIGSAERRGIHVKFGVGGAGGADLIGMFRGQFVAVEIKTPVGRQSEEQRLFQKLVESKQGIYRVVRSADEARALIAELTR